jgi:hypothetical protein
MINDSAVVFQVVEAAVALDADLGRIGSFDEGDVVVAYELVVQTGLGIIDGFLHFVFLLLNLTAYSSDRL